MLCLISQRYELKANHNLFPFLVLLIRLCLISQRYELKANHNQEVINGIVRLVVFNKSKIRVESKSQLYGQVTISPTVVFNKSKIRVESKSQLQRWTNGVVNGCV